MHGFRPTQSMVVHKATCPRSTLDVSMKKFVYSLGEGEDPQFLLSNWRISMDVMLQSFWVPSNNLDSHMVELMLLQKSYLWGPIGSTAL